MFSWKRLCGRGQNFKAKALTAKAKAWTFEANTIGLKAKAFTHTARVDVKMCIASDSMTG